MPKWEADTVFDSELYKHTRDALKVIPPILLWRPKPLEADVGRITPWSLPASIYLHVVAVWQMTPEGKSDIEVQMKKNM